MAEMRIAGSRGAVHDRNVCDEPPDGVGDLEHTRRGLSDEVVHTTGRRCGERGDDAGSEVGDVHELSPLAAVAGDVERLAAEGSMHEGCDHGSVARARAKWNAEPNRRRSD